MSKDHLVYSTDFGRVCPKCERTAEKCVCKELERLEVKGDGNVVIRRESKGRRGKIVTVISGLPLNKSELVLLLGDLKRKCGTGGTVKDGIIEIQGEHLASLWQELSNRGFKPKG